MHFAFSDDQRAFGDAVEELLADTCPPAVVRSAWHGEATGLWERLTAMGVTSAGLPEAAGGLGLDLLDLVLVLEASGRFALPEPLVETVAVATPLLTAVAGGADEAAAGAASASLARIAEGAVAIVADATTPVPWLDRAEVVIGTSAEGSLVVGPLDRSELVAQANVDGARPLFTAGPQSGTVLAPPFAADALLASALDRGAVAVAAQLCGLVQRMLAITVEYVKERKQFGAPIGANQAIKHHLANVAVKLDYARPVVHRAAYSISHGDPVAPVHASMAKACAADAALLAAKACLQCHGAIAYTMEHDLHLFMKRAWALVPAYGDPAWHRARVTEHLLGPAD